VYVIIRDLLTLLGIIAKDTAVLSKWSDRDPFDIPRKFYDSFRAGDNNSSLLFHTAVPVKGMSVIGSTDLCRFSQIALC